MKKVARFAKFFHESGHSRRNPPIEIYQTTNEKLIKMITKSTCKAQNPATCRYHGNVGRLEAKMQEASAAGNFAAYEAARNELEALSTHREFVETLEARQEEEEKPAAFKQQWVGDNHLDDDVIGRSLDAGGAILRGGISTDYSINADGTVLVKAYHFHEAEALDISEQWADAGFMADELSTTQRPSEAEAQAYADAVCARFLENDADQDYSEERNAWEQGVVQSIASELYGTEEDGYEKRVSPEALALTQQNVKFVHENGFQYGNPIDADDVLTAWDNNFGQDED